VPEKTRKFPSKPKLGYKKHLMNVLTSFEPWAPSLGVSGINIDSLSQYLLTKSMVSVKLPFTSLDKLRVVPGTITNRRNFTESQLHECLQR
jgi:hypothetical protein